MFCPTTADAVTHTSKAPSDEGAAERQRSWGREMILRLSLRLRLRRIHRLRAARSRLWLSTGQPFTTATALRLPFTQGRLGGGYSSVPLFFSACGGNLLQDSGCPLVLDHAGAYRKGADAAACSGGLSAYGSLNCNRSAFLPLPNVQERRISPVKSITGCFLGHDPFAITAAAHSGSYG